MAKYELLTIKNASIEMEVCNLGGIITKLLTPDSKGKMGDVVLGYNTPAEYLKKPNYFGALIGRVGNRINKGKFTLDGKRYKVLANEASTGNHLHGGQIGFDKVLWDMKACEGDGWKGVYLHYMSPDMEEGYPGNLDVSVWYKITDENELIIEYLADTDKPTLCNLTQHSYFNLSAGKSDTILDHHIKINADFFTDINKKLIPTGEIKSVKSTALDLRKLTQIRSAVETDSEHIKAVGGGFDHNYVLPNDNRDIIEAAIVFEPESGRVMQVFTDEVGIQFYSGNFLDGVKGKAIYNKHGAFCLETQHWPDSINHPHFPSIELYPNEQYSSTTVYKFSVVQ